MIFHKKLILNFALIIVIFFSITSTAKADSLTLPSGDDNLFSAVIDTVNGYAYFGTQTKPSKIVKIRLSDFSVVDTLTLSVDDIASGVIDVANGFAYFGTEDSWPITIPGKVLKIDLSTFTEVDSIDLDTGDNRLRTATIDTVNGYAYFGTYTTPGRIVKVNIDPDNFAKVSTITLTSPQDKINAVAIDINGGFSYFGTDKSPGRVIKIDLSTFTYVGDIGMLASEKYLTSAVIDVANGFVYFGTTYNTAPAKVIKIDLPTFSRVGVLDTDSTLSYFPSAVVDNSNGFAYFGAYGGVNPTKVIEVDLSTFTIADTFVLSETSTQRPRIAVIDTVNGYAYFGTDTSPATIYKISLVGVFLVSPTVAISAATDIETTSATLNGEITSTGGENPTVTVYWGTTDGGQTPANWANSSAPTSPSQPQGAVSFSANITGLTENTTYYFSAKATNGGGTTWATTSLNFTTTDITAPTRSIASSSSGGGGMPEGRGDQPTTPTGGFKIVINQGENKTSKRLVNLKFNAGGSNVAKMAISLKGDFSDASQENYASTKQIDLCSKFGGTIKNPTCPDGEYMVYVKFYTLDGVPSDIITQKITLLTTPQFSKPTVTFTKDLWLGSKDSQVKILQQFLNQNGFKLTNSGIGSAGKETDYFGQLTSAALTKFQEANKDKTASLITEKGYLGPITRQFINLLTNITTPVTPTQQTQNLPSAIFTTPLYKEMQSEDVRRLQKLLATKPEIYPEGLITGYFGLLTEKAVQTFQLKFGVVNSKTDSGFGVVGPKTRAKLQEVFGK